MKLVTSLFLTLSLIAFASLAQAQSDTIIIIHVNDSHGCIAAGGSRGQDLKPTSGGLARLATVLDTVHKKFKNVLTLHAGDFSVGDIMYNAYYGVPELEMLSLLGFDAMAVGNHEFDLTPSTLKSALDTAFAGLHPFPLLSANCILDDSTVAPLKKYIQPNVIRHIGHSVIGIFGMTTPSTNQLSQPAPAVIDTALAKIASAQVTALKAAGCNVIIMLSHLGYADDSLVVSKTNGIDLVVGGHDHYVFKTARLVKNSLKKSIPILQAGAHYEYVGFVRLVRDASGVRILVQDVLPLDASIAENPTIAGEIAQLQSGVEQLFGTVYSHKIAQASADFDEVADNLLTPGIHDTPVGNLVTDAFRALTKTDIAIEVGGSTADKLHKGAIVPADVFRMIGYGYNTDNGFDYRIATFKMKGIDLASGLEFGLSGIDQNDEFLVQASGMQYQYATDRPAFARLTGVLINGLPLDTGRVYSVTANEFAVQFLMAIGLPITDVQIKKDTAEFQVVSNYLASKGNVDPIRTGRVSSLKLKVEHQMGPQSKAGVTIFPNPSSSSATMQFTLDESGSVKITIVDESGKVVLEQNAGMRTRGSYSTSITTAQLPTGSYFCRIQTSVGSQSARFSVSH